jgi:hypothetical protein
VALLDRLPEWRRVYADPTAVHLQTPSRFSGIGVDHSPKRAATVLNAVKLMLHCNKIHATLVAPKSRTATRRTSAR